MKSKYWSNAFCMFGVALGATAFFQPMPDKVMGFGGIDFDISRSCFFRRMRMTANSWLYLVILMLGLCVALGIKKGWLK